MNKYYVELGEIGMDRIVEYYIAYSSKSPEELEDDMDFLYAVDNEINEMYYNYGEEDEDFEDFQDSMGIRCIETYSEDEHGKDDYPILFDERKKMNAFIKTDIENAVILMKAAIMNALHDIDMGVEKEIVLGPNISWNLFYTCLEEADWKVEDLDQWWDPNGWEVDFWCPVISPSGKPCIIDGSLWGQNYSIRINNE